MNFLKKIKRSFKIQTKKNSVCQKLKLNVVHNFFYHFKSMGWKKFFNMKCWLLNWKVTDSILLWTVTEKEAKYLHHTLLAQVNNLLEINAPDNFFYQTDFGLGVLNIYVIDVISKSISTKMNFIVWLQLLFKVGS